MMVVKFLSLSISLLLAVLIIFIYPHEVHMSDTINPRLYSQAIEQYNYVEEPKSDILMIVDFTKPSTDKRLWVFDVKTNTLLLNTWVAHGAGSGGLYATEFSNISGSNQSSLGTYRIADTYVGEHGQSIRVKGLDTTNSNAYNRAIVIHSAEYVGDGRAGRSLGCFAVSQDAMKIILSDVPENSVLYATDNY